MRRIYFLSPDIATTKQIVDDLLLALIEERHIHVVAKRGTELEDLPEANLLQKSDFVPAVERGLAVGGSAGGAPTPSHQSPAPLCWPPATGSVSQFWVTARAGSAPSPPTAIDDGAHHRRHLKRIARIHHCDRGRRLGGP